MGMEHVSTGSALRTSLWRAEFLEVTPRRGHVSCSSTRSLVNMRRAGRLRRTRSILSNPR